MSLRSTGSCDSSLHWPVPLRDSVDIRWSFRTQMKKKDIRDIGSSGDRSEKKDVSEKRDRPSQAQGTGTLT